jgi:hypothetical protein
VRFSRRWWRISLFCGSLHLVVWLFDTNVSEDRAACIFRVEVKMGSSETSVSNYFTTRCKPGTMETIFIDFIVTTIKIFCVNSHAPELRLDNIVLNINIGSWCSFIISVLILVVRMRAVHQWGLLDRLYIAVLITAFYTCTVSKHQGLFPWG